MPVLNHVSVTKYLTMTKPLLLLVASSLLGCGKAISDYGSTTVSAMSALEHYCFPRSSGPFSADSAWPSVTIMYSGITLTTTPAIISMCDTVPTVAPGLSIGGPDRSGNWTATSSTSDASPDSDLNKSVTGSATASASPGFGPDASLQSSLASAAVQNTSTTSSVLETSSRAVSAAPTPDSDGGNGSAISSGTVAMSRSVTDLSGSGQSTNDSALPTPPIGSDTVAVSRSAIDLSGSGQPTNVSTLPTPLISTDTGVGGPSDAASVTTADSRVPLETNMATISSGNYTLTQTGAESQSTLAAGTQASASAGLTGPAGASPGADATQQNGTINLSSPAIDALQLALFMKNLGAAVFNTSSVVTTRSVGEKSDTALLAKLVADISVVSSLAFSLFPNPFINLSVPHSMNTRK